MQADTADPRFKTSFAELWKCSGNSTIQAQSSKYKRSRTVRLSALSVILRGLAAEFIWRASCTTPVRKMDPMTIAAASGMRSRMESLDLLSNNIANTETGGYKTDREFYSLYTSADATGTDSADPSQLPVIEKNYTDFSQGNLSTTSNPLDFGLQGKGFFAVSAPGGTSYTRNGVFHLSPAGTIVNANGYSVQDTTGQPITANPSLPVTVSPDGIVTQSGQSLGQIALADFAPGDLVKQGSTMFRPANPNVTSLPGTAEILQGKVEGSNVVSSESTVRLVNVMRQFEMLQKAANIAGEMDRKSISDVAKIGP
jgi:flagellar basal-body rod protein FlgF